MPICGGHAPRRSARPGRTDRSPGQWRETETARLWTYVRDDRPFGGRSPPAALFRFSRDRRGEHPQKHLAGWQGILGRIRQHDPKRLDDLLPWAWKEEREAAQKAA